MSFKTIPAIKAAKLDQALMSTCGYSIDQLMELAGLSVAQSIYQAFPPKKYSNCLILCGPGNNGGDGLVAARHLKLFGYSIVKVYYPKPTNKELYGNLCTQLQLCNVEVIKNDDKDLTNLKKSIKTSDFIVDGLFGFSFKPPLREPFNGIITEMAKSEKRIVAIDVPSGWNVDDGPVGEVSNYQPDVLVSLTAPKPCSKFLNKHARHFCGGRFIPQQLADEWEIDVPNYNGVDQFVELK